MDAARFARDIEADYRAYVISVVRGDNFSDEAGFNVPLNRTLAGEVHRQL